MKSKGKCEKKSTIMASYSEEIVSELYRNRRDYFGHDMKEEQCKIITATLNRKNVMAILPTLSHTKAKRALNYM